jgi:hypothetical protein
MFYYITLHFDPPHETRMTTAAASDK